ncbi:MAG TPA: DUF4340 domain-containing protein [Bryobacteraceae bacterium]|nr:DUF4340 domain-containing protein [Bryobacteraceae bacterium]
MRLRRLLAAAVILAALAVGLYLSNKQKSAEAAKPPADTSPKILSLTDGDITKLSVKKKGGAETDLEKTSAGKWRMVSPEYPADQDAVNQLATAAATVNSDRVVDDKASDLKAYGLADPTLRVDITTKNGKAYKFRVGDDTPTNSGSYAMLEGDPRVFTVASYVKTGLDKTFNDLRDKRLLTFDQDKLSRVELIAKKQDVEFGRDKDQWQIVKPKPLRADGSQVDELIRKVKDAKMDLSVSDEDAKKAVSAFGSGTPVATVKFTDPSGTQQIEVRKNKDDYYARSSVVSGVYKLAADVGTGVDKGLDDFRNKKLFDFGFNDPSKIEMHDAGKAYAFQKTGDDWFSNGKKMDSTSVQSLLDKLRDLSASKFIDSGAPGAPSTDVAVTWSDGKRVEKVLISKQGSDYIAQRENEPALYGLDAKTVDQLSKAASDVKPAPAAPAKK